MKGYGAIGRCACVALLSGVVSVSAEPARPSMSSNEWRHVERALDVLNMSVSDLGFDKDVGEPIQALSLVTNLLSQPERVPQVADRLISVVEAGSYDATFKLAGAWLESVPISCPAAAANVELGPSLPAALRSALARFVGEAKTTGKMLNEALGGDAVVVVERQYAAASWFRESLSSVAEDTRTRLMTEAGIGGHALSELNAAEDALDPEPNARRVLRALGSANMGLLVAAGSRFTTAVDDLSVAARGCKEWPNAVQTIATAAGTVYVGTAGDDTFRGPALLILDPGGDDRYGGACGAADGFREHPLAAIVDLGGNDLYEGTALLGPGAALCGIAITLDLAGDDHYACTYSGLGSACMGVAWTEDRAGNDIYDALSFAEGAGYGGVGGLRDRSGRDLYRVGVYGQAFAGVRGVGLLIDDEGDDVYLAGRRQGDYERHVEHSLSLAQGFSMGMRPFAGGGVAALVDRAGNDTYEADVYGQGVSYWYALGMLVDLGGNDSYRMYEYGQGSGIHLSIGFMREGGGNDVYYGYSLAQGAAHDYAVGYLLDQGGNDMYTSDHYSQGRALNNSFALLLDTAGNDGYFCRRPAIGQGVGDDGGRREYGSISLLVDLAGQDRYTCGATNSNALVRPNYGVVYDFEEPSEEKTP